MSPKVRDSWYRIALFPTVETTLRTVAANVVTLAGGGAAACPLAKKSWVFDSESPSPPFRVGFVAALFEH